MKKLMLGILLVALIIGVSYLKTMFDENQRSEIRQKATDEAGEENADLNQAIDSLRSEAGRNQKHFDDSLVAIGRGHGEEVDSLHAALADRDANLDSLRKQTATMAAAQKKTSPPKPKPDLVKEDKNKTLELHRRVLAYYKKRHNDLPRDLTAYEQRVAISEIRTETAHRFKISVGKLNKIRVANNLEF